MSTMTVLKRTRNIVALSAVAALTLSACAGATGEGDADTGSTVPALEGTAEEKAAQFIDLYFQESVLTQEEQMEELMWFVDAAEPFQGLDVNVLSENIPAHAFESETLAAVFSDLTGINVTHSLMGEGDVMEVISTEIQTRTSVYDGFVNDTDSIGGHQRGDYIYPISTLLESSPTLPTLDLDDFIGLSFGTGSDGVIYQLPDQQFANLYWFRYDWFSDADIQAQFKDLYGYDLGVPVNWSAYEDIAVFFSTQVNGDGTIDGEKVYGHMDYGAKHFSLGWRFTDAWLSMAGNGDTVFDPETGDRTPNGIPVDEWGIRVENCSPVGSSVTRGGDTNGPASVYAVQKYLDWFEYAPPGAQNINFDESATVVGEGNTAQQMFWYTVFTRATIDSPAMSDANGDPVWRMAPSPHGAYWQDGHKLGYQDAGAWTFMAHADADKRDAAWLYAQFTVSKTVDLAKSIAGLSFIRDSTIQSDWFTENAGDYGGLIEFYRSPDRVNWTPTGTNVPDYPSMSAEWWQAIGSAAAGELTAQEALDQLATKQDEIMARLEASGSQPDCGVKLNEERDAQYWLDQPGAPYPKLANEKGTPETVPYDELVAGWFAGESYLG